MAQPPKAAQGRDDALWQHIGDLHKRQAEMVATMAAAQKPQRSPEQEALATMGMLSGIQSVFGPLKAAIERDADRDGEVALRLASVDQHLETLGQQLNANTQATNRLCEVLEVLASPRTRTAVVNLPGGPVQMAITEAHEKRKGH